MEKRRKLDKLNKMTMRLKITGIDHYIIFSILGEKRTHTHKKRKL